MSAKSMRRQWAADKRERQEFECAVVVHNMSLDEMLKKFEQNDSEGTSWS